MREETTSEGPRKGTSRPVSSRRSVVLGKVSPSRILSTKGGNSKRMNQRSECVMARKIRRNRKDRKAPFQMEQSHSFKIHLLTTCALHCFRTQQWTKQPHFCLYGAEVSAGHFFLSSTYLCVNFPGRHPRKERD